MSKRSYSKELARSQQFSQLKRHLIPRKIRPYLSVADISSLPMRDSRVRLFPKFLTLALLIVRALYCELSDANFLDKFASFPKFADFWQTIPSTTAFRKARSRLALRPLRILFERLSQRFLSQLRGKHLGSRRVLALDGVNLRVSDSPQNEAVFGRHHSSKAKHPAAFPSMIVIAVVDVASHLVVAARLAPGHRSETLLARSIVQSIPSGTLLLMDAAYTGYELWQRLMEKNVDFVVRAHKKIDRNATVIKRLGNGDEIVRFRPNRHVRKANPKIPETLLLRRITLGDKKGQSIYTTILDPKLAPAHSLRKLYWERIEVECVFDEIKTHLRKSHWVSRPTVFMERSPKLVIQSLYATLIAYNLVRRMMGKVMREKLGNGFGSKLSFVCGLEQAREGITLGFFIGGEGWKNYENSKCRGLVKQKLKRRKGRENPREVKMRTSKFPKKRPRSQKDSVAA